MENILDHDTVTLNEASDTLRIIDQTKLPNITEFLELSDLKDIWEAIYMLRVRGAPAIGVAAAIGLYVHAVRIEADTLKAFIDKLSQAAVYLNSSRPTAVNLSWALKRMENKALDFLKENKDSKDDEASLIKKLLKILHDEALLIMKEDTDVCRRIGEFGLTLIKKGDGILTHCNAGQLATSKYGTATAPMYLGHEKGYDLRIYCDETRPLLQGARLTSFELSQAGLDVTLLCDNMVSAIMKTGKINAVFVGCDRVAANGDVANKIGTSVVALSAKHYNVPFYVAAPTSTIDLDTLSGDDIVIEERKDSEVTELWYKERMAPENIKVFNPAFDVTDHSMITAIVTEKGIVYPPFSDNLQKIMK
ncbi:MAG: S-methyl-5-thioribose-1-phosphate isomerase [Lachnospiraceae bacterium]|nr:S-methyl-5-thioribose-1-phosphate isomerase [Lachnospiraceae bacterium]